jgi:hypothetical protein
VNVVEARLASLVKSAVKYGFRFSIEEIKTLNEKFVRDHSDNNKDIGLHVRAQCRVDSRAINSRKVLDESILVTHHLYLKKPSTIG